jgi:hypothetical protein
VIFLALGTVAHTESDLLIVDATRSLGPISPYVYGSNFGLYSVIPAAMMPHAQELGLRYVRLGGGDSDRRDLNRVMVDVFVLQARQIGAEPALTVRLLGGSPQAAADILRYANIEKGYNVRYWSIGNEPNLFEGLMGVPYTTEDLNRDWRAIAQAMLTVDPNIILVGPDITQYVVLSAQPGNIQYLEASGGGHPRDREGRDWLQEFLRANGDLVDIVSIHRYPYPGAGGRSTAAATIDGLRAIASEWDTSIPNLRQIIREAAGRDIPIAITELNSNSNQSSGGEAGLDTFYNAIWLADTLGRLIRQQVEIVAYWDLQGGPGRSWGLLDRTRVRPTYYVYLMYKHFGSELLAAESADPDVSIYVARREDGALTLMVVNLGRDEVTKTLDLRGFTPAGPAEVWRFDSEHNAQQIEPLDVSGGITLPGQSVTLFILTPASPQSADSWPDQYFAPYVYAGTYPLAYMMDQTGVRYFTLAFVLARPNTCQAGWQGGTPVESHKLLLDDLEKLRAQGGDVIVSFGGAAGDELALLCPDVESLTAAYQTVIDTLNVTRLDFDIEADEIRDPETVERRSQAIAALQARAAEEGRPLAITFTIGVLPTGLTPDGLALLQSALDNGVDVDMVNIMTMNYGRDYPPDEMGALTIQAAESLYEQLAALFPEKSEAELWGMIGLTPMIGLNDSVPEVFTPEDAMMVMEWARAKGIRQIAMWALNRDKSCGGNAKLINTTCSGIVQEDFAFSTIFNQFDD